MLAIDPAPRASVGAATLSKLASSLAARLQMSPFDAMIARFSARKTDGATGGSATLSETVAVAESRISSELLLWSTTNTVAPCWSRSRLSLPAVTTVLSSRTSVFARPTTWRVSFVTQTAPSPKSSRWAVYPPDTIATVVMSATTMVPLVAVATSERWAANHLAIIGRLRQH